MRADPTDCRPVDLGGFQSRQTEEARGLLLRVERVLGVNVLALARMLGHADPAVTLRVYADLFDTDLDAVAVALDAKCAQSVPKPCPEAPVKVL